MSVMIKICGITRATDALAAADAGADFLGLIFAPGSRRQVTLADAKVISQTVRKSHPRPPRIVGVFRDAEPEAIETVRRVVELDVVQLHGSEPPFMLDLINAPVIRSFPVSDSRPSTDGWESASWFLFDTASAQGGGSGRTFDWKLLGGDRPAVNPILLAGGLTPENVGEAVAIVQPDGVDVASGVEVAPGIKDHDLIRRFISEARHA